VLDAPNTHLDVGLLKPSEYDVSALPRKSRAPLVGITAGAFNASNPSADERVALPRFSSGPVAIDRYRGTYLATAGQIAAKRVGDLPWPSSTSPPMSSGENVSFSGMSARW